MNQIVFPSSEIELYSYNTAATVTGENIFLQTVQTSQPLPYILVKYPQLYNLIFAFAFSAFCGILSMFIHSISCFVKAMPIILFVPLFTINLIFEKIDTVMFGTASISKPYINFTLVDYVLPFSFFGKSYPMFAVFCLFIIAVAIGLSYLSYRIEIGGKSPFKRGFAK